ncbi:DUF523 domain-containing protein [Desulfovibrio inopinatus]|uniref:DUF523 domain-containing protein n=1 Tax=Desulfovibrio inopinatus TaxID=102109 RepID=UPI00041D9F18|nr:DUF523 domain-containing protein [Desulfovibrio inopinatus]
MEKTMYVVSACLIGEACRYNGEASLHPLVKELVDKGQVLAVCPEVLGGLSIPRPACEISGDRVITHDGLDLTDAYKEGAKKALDMALDAGCSRAVVKSRSPSCGKGVVYDGSFSGRLIPGNGVFAEMLVEFGIETITEDDLEVIWGWDEDA